MAGLSERVDWAAFRSGALNGIVFALPVALLGQLLFGDDASGLTAFVFIALELFSLTFAGWVAARQAAETPYATGAIAALATFVVVQAVGLISLSIRGEPIHPEALVFNALLAYGCGLLGAAVVVKQRNILRGGS